MTLFLMFPTLVVLIREKIVKLDNNLKKKLFNNKISGINSRKNRQIGQQFKKEVI